MPTYSTYITTIHERAWEPPWKGRAFRSSLSRWCVYLARQRKARLCPFPDAASRCPSTVFFRKDPRTRASFALRDCSFHDQPPCCSPAPTIPWARWTLSMWHQARPIVRMSSQRLITTIFLRSTFLCIDDFFPEPVLGLGGWGSAGMSGTGHPIVGSDVGHSDWLARRASKQRMGAVLYETKGEWWVGSLAASRDETPPLPVRPHIQFTVLSVNG